MSLIDRLRLRQVKKEVKKDQAPILNWWDSVGDSNADLPETVIVLDEATGIVARVKYDDMPLAITRPQYVRKPDGHLGAVEV